MKTYVAILIGIAVLFTVVFGGYSFMKKGETSPVVKTEEQANMKSVTGSVTRIFEGENKVEYSFLIPEDATTTGSMDGALIKISDASSTYATVYISYEGGRGFNALNYISEAIAPHVTVINPKGKVTLGENEWQIAESAGSEWHIAETGKGQWLVIVENRKTNHDVVEKSLVSFKTQ